MVTGFQQWGLRTYESYIRKDDKVENRRKAPSTMAVVRKSPRQKINYLSLRTGKKKHRGERMEVLKSMGDLHDTYEELFAPAFLMHAWVEVEYEYNIIVSGSIRRMMRSLHRDARRGRLSEKVLLPVKYGTTVWEFQPPFI